ncbi:DUF1616 domain-containing protein (plasmid) [Haloarcula sp. NS06]|uniref:DUF1616 domain-containing protein n=1 Tax=Haloarcula sp. NS06 TaxID=3409688 RepID=UPI003DA76AB8
MLVAALFPEANNVESQAGDSVETGITGIGRVALSFAASIVVVPTVGSLLNYTSFGLRLVPMVVSLIGIVVVLALVATRRRQALLPKDRFVVPWRSWLTRLWTEFMRPDSWTDTALNVLLVASIFASAVSVGYAVTGSNPGTSSTEFYLLNETDDGDSPTSIRGHSCLR